MEVNFCQGFALDFELCVKPDQEKPFGMPEVRRELFCAKMAAGESRTSGAQGTHQPSPCSFSMLFLCKMSQCFNLPSVVEGVLN